MSNDLKNSIFATYAPIYRDIGYRPRPLSGKSPVVSGWQLANEDLPAGAIDDWIKEYPNHNIGLAAGSQFPDGSLLGFLDVDRDKYVNLAMVAMQNPVCARIGQRGIVIPFRYSPLLKTSKQLIINGQTGKEAKLGEFLLAGSQCVIPPSVHPLTEQPYRWIGKPLHEINFLDLPLIGE